MSKLNSHGATGLRNINLEEVSQKCWLFFSFCFSLSDGDGDDDGGQRKCFRNRAAGWLTAENGFRNWPRRRRLFDRRVDKVVVFCASSVEG